MTEIESEWLLKAIKGDSIAFSSLIETYQGPVYNLCYRMLGDPNEAEDAAQETFLRAYRSIKRYDSQRPFSTWVLSIAAHYCIDQIRKRRFNQVSYEENPLIDPPDLNPGPESSLMMSEEQIKIQGLLKSLNPQDRAAIIMLYWYEFSYEEISQALSMSVSAVKSRLHRARIELAHLWDEQKQPALAVERKHHESPAF
ncbi:MAG: RNA polymerase sigma factor [Omnitrophica WOR_2 bacterium]